MRRGEKRRRQQDQHNKLIFLLTALINLVTALINLVNGLDR